jgi:uncharacterized protein YjdB/beta-glucanase (GH16 family)
MRFFNEGIKLLIFIIMRKLLIFFCLFITIQASTQTYSLVWSDEFIGDNILPDFNLWNNEVGSIRNEELQYYTDRVIGNQVLKNGNLLLIGKKEVMNGYQYTSASLTSKSSWKYGKMEANIKMQTGMGIWGCFWTLGKNMSWPSCGEIDIIEHINSEAVYHTTAHWWNETLTSSDKHQADGGDAPSPVGSYNANNFNKYGLEWTPSYIKWFVNDVCVKTMSILNGSRGTWEFHAPQGILLDCPIGGKWPQSQLGWDATKIPAVDTMFVDYVRVYSFSSGAPAAPTGLTSSSITQTSFTVNWAASSGATAYDVVLDNNGTISSYGPFSGTTCNISGLAANTNYAVRVKARIVSTNSSDLSEFSNPLYVTTTSTTPPTPLVNLQFNENAGTSTTNNGMAGGSLDFKGNAVWSTNVPANNNIRTSAISIANDADAVESPFLVDQFKGLNDITITGWLNCKDATETGGNRIVNCLGGQWFDATKGTGGFDLAYETDGSLQLGINEAIGTSSPRSSAAKITTDAATGPANWKFFAVTYSASSQSVSFYFGSTTTSATLDKTVAYNKGVVGNDMWSLAIGNFNSITRGWLTGRMFRGLIDQIQIYNSSLSLSQIAAVQNLGSVNLVTSVSVTPSTTTLTSKGATTTLTATVAPNDATNQTLAWSTSNPGVAIVSNTGVVTALSNGTSTISATSTDGSNLTSTSEITVTIPISGIVYEAENGQKNGSVVVSPESNASGTGVVSNFSTLNSFSKIYPVNAGGAGTGTITVRYSNGSGTTSYLSFHTYDLNGNPTFQCRVAFPNTGSYNNFADVTIPGTYIFVAGTSNANGFKLQNVSGDVPNVEIDKYTITLSVAVTGVTVSPTPSTVSIAATCNLFANVIPANASNNAINWSSSNTAIATVSATGLVTAVSVGTATITATTSEGGFTSSSVITVLANYVVNPGFEGDGAAVVKATGWAEYSGTSAYNDNSNVITGNVALGDAVGGAPHSGTYYVEVAPTVANPTTYAMANYQNFSNIPNGTYTLTGWFRGSGGGYFGIGSNYPGFPNLSHWTQMTIANVVISNGTPQIYLDFHTTTGQILDIDDIQLRPVITISGSQTSTALTNPNADISVSSSGDLTLDASRTVQSITLKPGAKLTLNSGQTITAGTLTLQSDATGSGTFVDNNTSNPPTLTATVNQYLPVVNRNWYVSSPIASATNTNLSTGTSVVSYNEAASNWTTETGTLTPGKGYISVSASGSGTGNVAFSGTLNTGSVNVGLTRLGSTKSGFNLVGNPYPSYLDFSKVDTTAAKIIPTIWFRTKTALDVYTFDTYNAKADIATTNGAVLVTKLIPPMQAFWVRVKEGQTAGTLNFTNAMRAHADNTNNRMKAPAATKSEQQVLRLQVSNGTNSDEAIILFNQNASNGYDAYDSPKMSNGNASIPEIFTLAGTEQLVINGLNSLAINQELPLGLTPGNSSTLSIKATDFNNFDANTHVILRDYLDPNNVVEQDLTDGSPYTFSSTLSTNRFALVFKTPSVTTGVNGNDANLNISVYKNGNGQITVSTPTEIIGKAIVSVYNTMGQKLEAKLLNNPVTVLTMPTISGVYFIKVQANNKSITAKVVIN